MSRRAIDAGLRVREVPITYDERVGRSKLSIPRDGVRFLWSILAASRPATTSSKQE